MSMNTIKARAFGWFHRAPRVRLAASLLASALSHPVLAEGRAASSLPHDLSPVRMFLAADIVVQGVMLSLLLASVVAWSIWLAKVIALVRSRRQLHRGLVRLTALHSLASDKNPGLRDSLINALLAAARDEVDLSRGAAPHGIKERAASRSAEIVRLATRHMRKGTGILASIGATAPFVGLFGTVWGIMNSFIGIARSQTTNLAVVAPGIAEALLATAIGLVAAIPAVLFYNHLTRLTAGNKALMDDAAARVERLVSRDLDLASPHPTHLASPIGPPGLSLGRSIKLAAE